MKIKTTLWLLLFAVFMAAAIWYVDHAPRERPVLAGGPLLKRTADRVERISLIWPEKKIVCERVQGVWNLCRPVAARADEVELDRILAVLNDLRREEVVSESERVNRQLTLSDYGLDEPRVRVVLGGPLGDEEIWVGHDAPLDQRVYVKLGDEKSVIATGRSILGVLTDKVEQLRDRRIFRGQPGDTVRLGIKRRQHGFLQVARTETGWVVQQPLPFPVRADENRVAALLTRLFGLHVKQFVWDPPVEDVPKEVSGVEDLSAGQANVESHRLAADEAAATVTLWVEGEEVGRELLIGETVEAEGRDEVYARIEGVEAVFTLDEGVLDLLAVDLGELRDRRVFAVEEPEVERIAFAQGDRRVVLARDATSGWVVREPVQWQADSEFVDAMVKRLAGLRVKSFVVGATPDGPAGMGLAPPAYTVTLNPAIDSGADAGERGEGHVAKVNRLQPPPLDVGSVAEEATTAFIRIGKSDPDGQDSIYEVSADEIRGLVPQQTACDPLQYRDRTILSLPMDTVRRISLVRKGVAQAIRRGETGAWEPETPSPGGELVGDAVGNLLFVASNLRALRVEDLNPQTLAPYGLDAPEVTLTFGLTGEEGIQKTLLFGHRARTDGIFVMVQGQDVVFALDRDLVNLATRNLVHLPDPPPEESSE